MAKSKFCGLVSYSQGEYFVELVCMEIDGGAASHDLISIV